ncbi:hypothetical protein ACOMHN_006423 [Nucella lapillus]
MYPTGKLAKGLPENRRGIDADGATPNAGINSSSNETLMQIYLKRYNARRDQHLFSPIVLMEAREAEVSLAGLLTDGPCWIQGCNASFLPLQERLQSLLHSQHRITKAQKNLIDNLANHPKFADMTFITAASSNHFDESQGVIRDLHRVVFPELQRQENFTFQFYYYNLGLTEVQLTKLKKYCNCTVIAFPFKRLPYTFRKLGTCIWKPLIVKAHLRFSRFTMWMDASVRFLSSNISAILEQTRKLGILLAGNGYMLVKHVHPAMLSYFHVQPCLLASFHENCGGFIVVSNDKFVQKAIVDPWVACAFSPRCLCPSVDMTDCESYLHCHARSQYTYFQCHRFDQSALGIILALLFDWRATNLNYLLDHHDRTPWFVFRRADRVRYFPNY